jgi:hypothetical protein
MRFPARAMLLAASAALAVCASAYAAPRTTTHQGITQTIDDIGPVDRTVSCVRAGTSKSIECPDTLQFEQAGAWFVDSAQSHRRFDTLDQLYARWCSGKDRFPEGTWKLAKYEAKWEELFRVWNDWERYDRFLKDWKAARPGSEAARFTEAVYWHTYAWSARGGNYANTVSAEGWALFNERLKKAHAILAAPRAAGQDCAAWYPLQIDVAHLLGKQAEARAAFDKGSKLYPEYHQIYFAMARGFEPKWGGTAAAYDAFAEQVTRMTSRFEGRGMYARMYWIQDCAHCMPFNPDNPKSPTWNKLRAGYDALLKKYPGNFHITNQYASVACRSSDSAAYRALRNKTTPFLIEENFRVVPVRACDRRHKWVDKDEE